MALTEHEIPAPTIPEAVTPLKGLEPVYSHREALERIHAWLVCHPIATAEDMARSFPEMERIASEALVHE